MLKKGPNKYACTDIENKHQRGFTMVSMLITMTILIITLPLLTHVTKHVSYSSNYDELSVQQFFHFLRDECMQTTAYKVDNKKVVLDLPDGKKATLQRYNNLIQRQVDGKGFEVFLRDVKGLQFSELPYGVH